jgi:hypothetical protein
VILPWLIACDQLSLAVTHAEKTGCDRQTHRSRPLAPSLITPLPAKRVCRRSAGSRFLLASCEADGRYNDSDGPDWMRSTLEAARCRSVVGGV